LGKTQEAYEHFMRAALVDLEDVRGNTNEGIHGASTGGMWQAVIFGFAGVRLTEMGPIAGTSHLPPGWTRLEFKLQWRGNWREFDVRPISAAPSAQIKGFQIS
jgi:kojibiose phosphorylase